MYDHSIRLIRSVVLESTSYTCYYSTRSHAYQWKHRCPGYQGNDHQGGGDKYDTGAKDNRIHASDITTIGTWNARILRAEGKLDELTYEMDNWHIVVLCEVRWKNFGETSTHEGHKFYFSGIEGMDFANTDMSCQPISSKFITIRLRLRATPFNITIIQAYGQTSDYSGEDIEDFYDQL